MEMTEPLSFSDNAIDLVILYEVTGY